MAVILDITISLDGFVSGGSDDGVQARAVGAGRVGGVVVVTHQAPEHVRLTDRMTIVTTGLRDALDQATAAAGDKDVYIMGGGELGGSALREGVVDRVHLHVAPLLLGSGTSLFEGTP